MWLYYGIVIVYPVCIIIALLWAQPRGSREWLNRSP